MPGNADVHDEVLARAAAGGDRDAFGALFERHLGAVFTAAWLVLRDPAVAAEIVRDTFLAAWQEVDPDDFADSLVASADHKARGWLTENPQRLAAMGPDDPPAIGPVLRARIVTALEVQGVPTRARPDGHRPPVQRRKQLGIAGAAAVALLVGAVVALGGNAGGDEAERTFDGEAASEPISEDDEKRPATTSTTASGSTATMTAPAADTTEPTRSRSTAPTGRPATPPPTPAPSTPPAPPPPPPTTAPTSGPRIIEFTGKVVGSCGSGGVNYEMTWRTSGGSWVWIWPSSDPDPWQDVGGPNGSATRCTHHGETWNIATRHDGTDDNDWREVRASRVV